MLPGALSADLGEQQRTESRETTAGIPAPQRLKGNDTSHRSGADAAMRTEYLIALDISIAYLLISTTLLLKGVGDWQLTRTADKTVWTMQ